MGPIFFGHALPGVFLILLGVWWALRLGIVVVQTTTRLNRPLLYESSLVRIKGRTVPGTGVVLLVMAAALCLREMIDEGWSLAYHEVSAHLTLYGALGVVGLAELLLFGGQRWLGFPDALLVMHNLAFAMFMVSVGFVFMYHTSSADLLANRVHSLFYNVALILSAIHVGEMFLPRNAPLAILRVVVYFFLGTWLITMG
jgi:hypothetical protein